jgi:D-aminopeptidase
MLAYLPIIERRDAHTVRFTASDMVTISRFIEFIVSYCPDIEP